jgi:hypothetical protein
MAMELPTLGEFFDSVAEVKDARLSDECTTECDACDCTRAVKLPGVPLSDKLKITRDEISSKYNSFVDFGRIPLNRKRQGQGLDALEAIFKNHAANNIKPVVAGTAISGLYVIFKDYEYFRIKNIPDTTEARRIVSSLGLELSESVESIKSPARNSLAQPDKRSNIV